MASLLKTKPKWCTTVEATEQGWVNSVSGELLVSLRGLKSKLAAEEVAQTPIIEQEVIMETKVEEAEVVVLKEQTVKKPKKNQKIIAEVVEYNLEDKTVIGE